MCEGVVLYLHLHSITRDSPSLVRETPCNLDTKTLFIPARYLEEKVIKDSRGGIAFAGAMPQRFEMVKQRRATVGRFLGASQKGNNDVR